MSKTKTKYFDFICSEDYEKFNLDTSQTQNVVLQSSPHPEYIRYLKNKVKTKLHRQYAKTIRDRSQDLLQTQ